MLKVLELFGGIGACSKALERLGIDYKIVDYVEIDKNAVKSFNAIHITNFKPQDICNWDKDIQVDLIMHGSPCQDFSISGKQKGGDEGSGSRSSLMYETIRIVEKLKPKFIIWENVKNMLSKKHIHNFNNYCNKLNELGYNNYYNLLNSKDYGIPQNRERVFTISIRKDLKKDFKFPEKQKLNKTLYDFLQKEVDKKYYLSEEKIKFINETKKDKENYIQYERYKGWYEQLCRVWKNISPTLHLKSQYIEIFDVKNNIRRITPLEAWRLMGFDDIDFYKAQKVCSETQLFMQAGNSIVVNVLENILKELL